MKSLLAQVAAALLALLFVTPVAAQSYPPYHDITDRQAAQAEAQTRHLPLAWLGGFQVDLKMDMPETGSQAELTQLALSSLEDHAVVVFFEGSNMGPVPAIVHAQDHIADDGTLPGGAAWNAPKIVFTDSAVTHTLGRVSATQMAADRDMPISKALAAIRSNPFALDALPTPGSETASPPTPGTAAPASILAPAPVIETTAPDAPTPAASAADQPAPTAYGPDVSSPDDDIDMTPDERGIFDFLHNYGLFLAIGASVLVVLSLATWRQGSARREPPPKRGRY